VRSRYDRIDALGVSRPQASGRCGECRVERSKQTAALDGFGQMRGEPRLLGPGAVCILSVARQRDESRQRRAKLRTQSNCQLLAVHHGQTNVQEGDVGVKGLHDLERRRPVLGRHDDVPGVAQKLCQKLESVFIVVDHEDPF